MATIIELPEGFVLDEPINNNLPDGFILDEPSNSQPISTPKPYKKAQKQEPINYKKDVDTLYDIPQVDMPAKNDGYLTNSDGNKVYTANVGLTQNWDNKGRVYYTDESGERVKFKVNPIQTIGRKFKAFGDNAYSWINNTNPESEAYKQKANLTLMAVTAPFGLGKAATQWGIGKLTPFLGKKIAQNVAEGAGSGLVSGGVYGGVNAAIAGENPIVGAIEGGTAGLTGGALIGGTLGKSVQLHKGNKLKNAKLTNENLKNIRQQETKYYKDYIQGTSTKRTDLGDINYTQAGLETVSKRPNAGKYYPNLKNDIKTAEYIGEEMPNHSRNDDIVKFHRLKNGDKEFLIGETTNGKKYYMSEIVQDSGKVIEPSNFGVADIDSDLNRRIAQQIEREIIAEQELLREYKMYHADIVKEYGSIENFKAQAIKEMKELEPYGAITPALNKYREIIEYEKLLQNARYVNTNIRNSTTREIVNNSNPDLGLKYVKSKKNIVGHQPSRVEPTTSNTIIPQLEQNVTPITEIKPSRLAQNAEKSKEVAKYIEENPPMYEVLHNADLQTNATNEIIANPEKVRADIISKMTDEEAELTALDFEKSRQLFQSLQEQGRFDEAINLLQGITQKGTKAGQAVQALSMWSKTTPLGAQKYAQMLLDKYNKGVRKELQKHLTKEELQEIGKTFEELHAKGLTERELEVETAKAMKKVYKVVPKTWAQKLEGYRYINMLLSPKSRIKDALLTAKNAGETAIDETIAGGIDKLRSLVTKDKTRYISANPLVGRRAWIEGAKKGFREGVEDVKYGINTSRSGEVGRYGIPNTPTFEGGLLGNAEKLLRYSLNVPDRTFFEARYASSLANQMKARGVTEPTQDIINSAINEAKKAVYQENRPITGATQKLANAVDDATMRAVEQAAGLPKNFLPSASKSIAPFIKTPTNVIAQGAEGLHGGISGFLKLLNAQTPEQIREAELLMGRGARGLGELGLGLGLGKGILDNVKTNIGSKDYYENEITGLKPNSIAIGDKAISLMNMQNNLPLFAGVGLGQNGLSGAYLTIADEIANMPALKALGDLYNLNKEAKYLATSEDKTEELKKLGGNMVRSLGVNYLTSLLPFGGTLGELRNDIDPYARELYTESIPEYIGNRIVNRLPFASKTLPMKYNAIGEPVMVNNIQNPISRALSEAVDFGIRNYTPNETYNELNQFKKDISNSDITGKTLVGVGKAKRKVNINGEQIPLTNKQYSQYQKVYGKLSKNLKGGYYDANANISDEENAKILADIDKSIKEAIAIKELGQAPKKKLKPYTEDILNNWDEYRGTNE